MKIVSYTLRVAVEDDRNLDMLEENLDNDLGNGAALSHEASHYTLEHLTTTEIRYPDVFEELDNDAANDKAWDDWYAIARKTIGG